ncbi:aminotransferase class V-fold PLP-dependent enzyme [Clostridium sp. MSJ-11]|uniref:Aminotransferase class V-fold PLP-dependent enzyme n=1 Tax=Clostridium mobile TaxID=2841512 RepID=A0ABS6EF47_9CLOT|nr:aminotransferase class V-fold PLP-dependent enzyme [Clostridium mobile]MBU5483658.1 aminotransferase class V-fold PLP-dependent enzyme [Clostridium mobile]
MIYLDNAATSFPKPEKVYNEVLNCMKNYAANPGRSSHDLSIKASAKILETREEIASFFNISNPFNIVFTKNATEALNIGIKGVLERGDHVITTVTEHNSVLRPLNSLMDKGISVTFLDIDEEGYIDINILKEKINKNTKLIIINHVSNVIGTIQNISEIGKIAKENGVIFMIDASQSAGSIDIDMKKSNIDLLAFPGHKGLLGPQGTGGLFISEDIDVNHFSHGGTGSNSDLLSQPNFLPDKFESGTLNVPAIAGLCEGIKFIKTIGINDIKSYEEELTNYLISEIQKLSFIKIYGPINKKRASVVSINLDGIDSSTVGYLLNQRNIAVRTGYHCAAMIHKCINTSNLGTVRISPNYFNKLEDIEKLIDSLKDIYNHRI